MINIIPNVAKTLDSLRHLTYTNESALADIVDNSLDAGASQVKVDIDIKNKKRIVIWDDGCGMDSDTLTEAIKLGSNTQKDGSALGKFGMGLVTAGLSLGRKISVVTKDSRGLVYKRVLDLDTINDDWTIPEVVQLTQEEMGYRDLWDILDTSGTVVTIEKLDNTKQNIVSETDKWFRRMFRFFLATKEIYINGTKLSPVDPMERKEKETNVYVDTDVQIDGQSVHVFAVEVRNGLGKESKYEDRPGCLPFSEDLQGFYYVRNQREIEGAKTLISKYSKNRDTKLYKKHPETNAFRCEVSFPSSLDAEFGVSFDKQHVDPIQKVLDILNDITKSARVAIRTSAEREKAVDPDNRLDHSEAEKAVKNKKSLLIGNGRKEKRYKNPNPAPMPTPQPGPNPNPRPRVPIKVHQTKQAMPVEFREAMLGADNGLFNCWTEGTKIIVEWNIQHPFYFCVMAKNKDKKNITTPIDLLIYSLAQARLSLDPEEDATLYASFGNLLNMVSTNLRVLLQ